VPILCEYLSIEIDLVFVGEREDKLMFDNRVRMT
jgi:hypothetical protein